MVYLKKEIDGELFERLLLSGAAKLESKVDEVNELNVFPIPDGDTGENMYMTIKGGVDKMVQEKATTVTDKASALAEGMLLNARGNSGVILSQLFFGLAEGLKGKTVATLGEFAKAMGCGVKRAYSSVVHPVEGTILTVAREAVEKSCEKINPEMNLDGFFKDFLTEMKISLDNTPELLASLKESGVIDSGGAGLVYIVEGFYKAVMGEDVVSETAATVDTAKSTLDFSKFTADSEMEFGYCTELLLQLQNSKVDVDEFSVQTIIDYLNTLGDSIVAFKTGSIIKMHVHTMTPWKVLEFCQRFGEYLSVKIENMTLQHNESVNEKEEPKKKIKRARRKYALVTVASGDGLVEMFKELGADYVINGGQTNNPSSEDFIEAFDEVNADNIFVLPNNGNIVLTAKQAASIYTDSKVIVIESKNIGQGYSALSMLDYSVDDVEKIKEQFISDMQGVTTGMLTTAIRTTTVNGLSIKKGDYIGFTDHVMLVANADKCIAIKELVDKICQDKSFLIVIYGAGTSEEQALEIERYANSKYPNIEVYLTNGGQDVYDYILIAE